MGVFRKQEKSKLVRLEELRIKAKRFEMFQTSNSLETIQNKLVDLNRAGDRKKTASETVSMVDQAKVTLEREHEDRKIEKRVVYRSRRGLAMVTGLFGAMLAVGHMLYNPPPFIRTLPSRMQDNWHLAATAVITALAVIPLRDFIFTRRFNSIKIETERLLIEIKKELQKVIGQG